MRFASALRIPLGLVLLAAVAAGCAERRPAASSPGERVAAIPSDDKPSAPPPAAEPLRIAELEDGQFRVCAFAFHSPYEIEAIKKALPEDKFVFTDLSPVFAGGLDTEGTTLARKQPGWFRERCREDLQCDIVVYSAEFAGAFFGNYGYYLPLQEMEEAACREECAGIFSAPREVFLMACNTLATKNADHRTPEEYYHVLLAHGFSHADAQRVVALRYGPLGPSFREATRRIFMDVPRIYGFSSVAPRGQFTAPRLAAYFKRKGDYAKYLERVGREDTRNGELLAAFAGAGLVQTSGATLDEPAGADRALVCRLYDEGESVRDRLDIVHELFERDDFLTFVPPVEVFLGRNPPAEYSRREKKALAEIQKLEEPRREVMDLVNRLELSVVKTQLANLALQLSWMTPEEHRAMAEAGLKQLLAEPLSTEVADIGCELAQYTPATGAALRSEDIPDQLFWHPEGYRLIDCLHPADPALNARMVAGLNNIDEATRIWATFALWRRRPLDDQILIAVAPRLQDNSAEVRERARKIFTSQAPLSAEVAEAIDKHDKDLAAQLAQRDD